MYIHAHGYTYTHIYECTHIDTHIWGRGQELLLKCMSSGTYFIHFQ